VKKVRKKEKREYAIVVEMSVTKGRISLTEEGKSIKTTLFMTTLSPEQKMSLWEVLSILIFERK
jgi:hypothetical protein